MEVATFGSASLGEEGEEGREKRGERQGVHGDKGYSVGTCAHVPAASTGVGLPSCPVYICMPLQ